MRRTGIRRGRGDGTGDGADAADSGTADAAPDPEPRERQKRPRSRRGLVWTAGSLAFLLTVVTVVAYVYIRHLNSNLEQDDLNLGNDPLEKSEPNAQGETSLNILLIGTDSRTGEDNEDLGGASDLSGGTQRADVLMLLHLSADRSNITLVSIPRDTQVTIPECTDSDTGEVYEEEESASINESLSHGGPGCTVATVEELTGVPIDHFMMVDFSGVVEMADAVGGVPVCVDANVYDPDSGLRLEQGTTVVTGKQALQWLRTRHGFEDGSDIGRTKAQQMYLTNMFKELEDSATLTNAGELMDLAEAATSALTVDHGLGSVGELYDLATDLREVPSDRTNMITMPWETDPADPNRVIPSDEADTLWSMIREDVALDSDGSDSDDGDSSDGDSSDGNASDGNASDSGETATETQSGGEDSAPDADGIEVAVQNGTGSTTEPAVDGRATEITDELHRLGFTSAVTDDTPAAEASTVVLYPDSSDRAAAESVADALGLPADSVQISPSSDQITLIVGNDWREGASYASDDGEQDDQQNRSGDESSGAGGDSDNPFDDDDIISGEDEDSCMQVNPAYTW